jgi:hypothetical protein
MPKDFNRKDDTRDDIEEDEHHWWWFYYDRPGELELTRYGPYMTRQEAIRTKDNWTRYHWMHKK